MKDKKEGVGGGRTCPIKNREPGKWDQVLDEAGSQVRLRENQRKMTESTTFAVFSEENITSVVLKRL